MRISEGTPPERTLNDGATFPRQFTYTTRTLRLRSREKNHLIEAALFGRLDQMLRTTVQEGVWGGFPPQALPRCTAILGIGSRRPNRAASIK